MSEQEKAEAIREAARLLNVSQDQILVALRKIKAGAAYDVWRRPKRPDSLEMREFQNPCCEELKRIQSAIKGIIAGFANSEISHGYVDGRYPPTALQSHLESNAFLAFDIKNAFPSTRREKIKLAFYRLAPEFQKIQINLTEIGAELMAALVTYCPPNSRPQDAFLPQGSGCSPTVFNLVLKDIDRALANFASRRNYQIVRFSDNFLVSAKVPIPEIDRKTAISLVRNGGPFSVPEEKISYKEVKPQETGVVFELLGLGIEIMKDGSRRLAISPETLGEYRFAILKAIEQNDFSEKTFLSLRGKIAYVKRIYPEGTAPPEVMDSWQKYCSMRDATRSNRLV